VIDVRVPMGREQAKLYQHFLDRGNIDCKNALVRARKQIAYLRGICADPHGFEYGGPPVRSNFNPKTIAILELTRDILAKGKQVVIVNARKGQTNTIQMKLQDAGIPVARIDSTVPAAQHSHQANLFKSGRVRVMLMGIKCAQGYSFEKCSYLIIGSLEYSSGSKNQAEGRVFRVNSKDPITTYCVLHQHSIEEIIFDVVATKQDAATICLHGERVPREYKPLDMDEVLADSIKRFELNGQPVEFDCESKWPMLRASLKKAALAR
jgi:SNF2 family DNA or RNA helicase